MNQILFHLKDGNSVIKNDCPLSLITTNSNQVDKLLCDYFNIDYQQVNAIELV